MMKKGCAIIIAAIAFLYFLTEALHLSDNEAQVITFIIFSLFVVARMFDAYTSKLITTRQTKHIGTTPLEETAVVKPPQTEPLIGEPDFKQIVAAIRSLIKFGKTTMQQKGFRKYFKDMMEGSDGYDPNYIMERIIGKDMLMCLSRIGFPNKIDIATVQGQCLYLVIDVILSYDESRYNETYEDFSRTVSGGKGDYDVFVSTKQTFLDIYNDSFVTVTRSDGKEDFGMVAVIHNFCPDKEDEYRERLQKVVDLLIAVCDIDQGSIGRAYEDMFGEVLATGKEPGEKGEAKAELDQLIGLTPVKHEIITLANYIKVQKLREANNMKVPSMSYHCVFTGNPGTGKTTVARILAGIYRDMGVLKKGHLVETDRSGLVAEYVGQTAIKTNKIIDRAIDGMLFIDEAYTLLSKSENDYGREAIATLLKRMEDSRNRLVVVLAGYTREMEDFIQSNPGLRSRFTHYIEFPDYSAEELYDIFRQQVAKNEFELSEGASECLMLELAETVKHKSRDFGNGRYVRNLFERTIAQQANRLSLLSNPSKHDLSLITGDDIINSCHPTK